MDIQALERNLPYFQRIAAAIGCPLLDVCTVIAFETAGTFDHLICNVAAWTENEAGEKSKEWQKSMPFADAFDADCTRIIAMGWIQFVAKTLRGFGKSFVGLSMMTKDQQAQLVIRYLAPHQGRLDSLEELYMAILWPSAIGQNDDYVLFRGPDSRAYRQNRGLDRDRDGAVDRAEVCRTIRQWRERLSSVEKLLPCWERTPPECPV
jgi:hypothetical protein